VKVVAVPVVERHDIRECVETTKPSPVGCRNVVLHLLELHKTGELCLDPKQAPGKVAFQQARTHVMALCGSRP